MVFFEENYYKNMKTIIINFSIVLASMFFFSCRGGEVLETISESEAAEVIGNAISAETEGLTEQVEDAADIAAAYLDSCGTVYDSLINKTQGQGIRTYDYTLSWSWQMTCNSLSIPQTLSMSYTSDGLYDTPRMSSQDQSNGNFTVSGLEILAAEYVFNGAVSRSGSQVSKLGNQNSFTSQVQMNMQNVAYHKNDLEVSSGTADVTISGTDSNGNSFSFSGDIVFNGGKTATLTINGTAYPIQW